MERCPHFRGICACLLLSSLGNSHTLTIMSNCPTYFCCMYTLVNPRRACAARVTVVGSVCLLLNISPPERLFVSQTIRCTLRATKARNFKQLSLRKARAPPALYGYHTESPFLLCKKRACAVCKRPFARLRSMGDLSSYPDSHVSEQGLSTM